MYRFLMVLLYLGGKGVKGSLIFWCRHFVVFTGDGVWIGVVDVVIIEEKDINDCINCELLLSFCYISKGKEGLNMCC